YIIIYRIKLMRLSQIFSKTKKQFPSDEQARNAQLLIQAGFIHKEMAGVYSYLPLGLRTLNNITTIIREEMNAINGQEILMPALQIKERYEATGRWDDKVVDDWFKTKLVNGTELGLGFSHEENLVPLMKNYINSYRDLPLLAYQIQTKFRNELRSKSGLMRGREFLMKDMYSFAISQKQHDDIYLKVQKAYIKIFDRLGISKNTFMTKASGGSFSKYSHEFQTLCDAGEDTIYLDRNKKLAINKEVFTDEVISDLGLKRENLEKVRAIEVANIFSLGTKYTEPFTLRVSDQDGKNHSLIMGCYGIGISRLLGTIAEIFSDKDGLVWPEAVAPAKVVICRLSDEFEVVKDADKLYNDLIKKGIDVLYDDRDLRAGSKLTDADLMGIPHRIVISSKTVKLKVIEYKSRISDKIEELTEVQLLSRLSA
ncbi:MAG TPA: aminoacyl--tRNA ligase-related protein, partial [Candidatus Saccharimonadia bacterium]|nr:aminoacyl--tRNA ligase-related protein [Candidatus Saccharimonadia bacterium]